MRLDWSADVASVSSPCLLLSRSPRLHPLLVYLCIPEVSSVQTWLADLSAPLVRERLHKFEVVPHAW